MTFLTTRVLKVEQGQRTRVRARDEHPTRRRYSRLTGTSRAARPGAPSTRPRVTLNPRTPSSPDPQSRIAQKSNDLAGDRLPEAEHTVERNVSLYGCQARLGRAASSRQPSRHSILGISA